MVARTIGPSPLALYRLGQALERQGAAQKAADAYAAALRLAPGMTDAKARLEALRAKPE